MTASTSRASDSSAAVSMRRSIQLNLPPAEVKTVSERAEISARPELKEVSGGSEIRFTTMLAACGGGRQEKEIAIAVAKGNASLWSRMKAGEPGCNVKLDDLPALPVDVQVRFVTEWAKRIGLEIVSRERKRMAIAKAIGALAEVAIVIEETA